jgi:hypothetical protein
MSDDKRLIQKTMMYIGFLWTNRPVEVHMQRALWSEIQDFDRQLLLDQTDDDNHIEMVPSHPVSDVVHHSISEVVQCF